MRSVQQRLFNRMAEEAANLRAQIHKLEARLQAVEKAQGKPKNAGGRPFDMAAYPRRKIALLFSYEGWHYSGLAYQNQWTPLPTVEGELMAALQKARLVDPAESFEDVGFSRCGRTDRGVSSSGQVVSLWVRSNLAPDALEGTQAIAPGAPIPTARAALEDGDRERNALVDDDDDDDGTTRPEAENARDPPPAPLIQPSSSIKAEFNYAQMLNRLLDPSIRVLGWSPVDRLFDARFSCLGRHYKYFFSSSPSHPLDLAAMREAASQLLGEHDFRNMCKIDASKQITNFRRRIDAADISLLSSTPSTMPEGQPTEQFVFNLHGTAFLYHQVRHIMAVLFLVGSGLEQPGVVGELLNVAKNPTKPDYEMAHDLPLVLWKCDFAAQALSWQAEPSASERMEVLLEPPHIQQQIRDLQSRALHGLASSQRQQSQDSSAPSAMPPVFAAQLGAGTMVRTTKQKYVPLSRRKRGDHYELVNQRWRESEKGRKMLARFAPTELSKGGQTQDNQHVA